jgi:hypothetical protein
MMPEAEGFDLFFFIRGLPDVIAVPPQGKLVIHWVNEEIEELCKKIF